MPGPAATHRPPRSAIAPPSPPPARPPLLPQSGPHHHNLHSMAQYLLARCPVLTPSLRLPSPRLGEEIWPWCELAPAAGLRMRTLHACRFGSAALACALSPRLSDVLGLTQLPLDCGSRPDGLVADVGCDHGYLAAELVARGRDVVAIDAAAAPLDRARHHFSDLGLAPRAFVLGDGLSCLESYCETAIMAGVGARTAAGVVRAAARRRHGPPRRWIVQPTQQFITHVRDLRLALHTSGYAVVAEVWRDDNGAPGPRRPFQRGRRYLVTMLADLSSEGRPSAPTELSMLVGQACHAVDATPNARLAYVAHHRDWLASIATGDARRTTHIRRVRRWHGLLAAEAVRLAEDQ